MQVGVFEHNLPYATAAAKTARWAVARAAAEGCGDDVIVVQERAIAALDTAIDVGLVALKETATLDAAMFVAWLVRQTSAPRPAAPKRSTDNRCVLHPCEAASWMAAGEMLTPAQVRARIACAVQLRGIVVDADVERLELSAETRSLVEQAMFEAFAFLNAFKTSAGRLSCAVLTLRIECASMDYGRLLHAGDFACPLKLDVVDAAFLADTSAFDDEWDQARAACQRIGQVRLNAAEFEKRIGPRPTTAAARRRGADALRAGFEQWRLGAAPMPRRAHWVSGDGLEIVGNKHAAGAVWAEVTRDPAYAQARRPGRRRP